MVSSPRSQVLPTPFLSRDSENTTVDVCKDGYFVSWSGHVSNGHFLLHTRNFLRGNKSRHVSATAYLKDKTEGKPFPLIIKHSILQRLIFVEANFIMFFGQADFMAYFPPIIKATKDVDFSKVLANSALQETALNFKGFLRQVKVTGKKVSSSNICLLVAENFLTIVFTKENVLGARTAETLST